jgi:uncharacterized Fe-S cluster-containing radical SAM superfamily protein
MSQSNALERLRTSEFRQRPGVLRADAVDLDLIHLARCAPCADWERQDIPKRKTDVINQEIGVRRGGELAEVRRCKQDIDLAGDRGEIQVGAKEDGGSLLL